MSPTDTPEDQEQERISRRQAKALVEDADWGVIMVGNFVPIPTIGEVPLEEMRMTAEFHTYRFGEHPDEKYAEAE